MAKAKLTWLGGPGEPDSCEWNGKAFKKGEAVEVDDARMIEKAKTNQFFEVTDEEKAAEEPRRGPGRPPNPPKTE